MCQNNFAIDYALIRFTFKKMQKIIIMIKREFLIVSILFIFTHHGIAQSRNQFEEIIKEVRYPVDKVCYASDGIIDEDTILDSRLDTISILAHFLQRKLKNDTCGCFLSNRNNLIKVNTFIRTKNFVCFSDSVNGKRLIIEINSNKNINLSRDYYEQISLDIPEYKLDTNQFFLDSLTILFGNDKQFFDFKKFAVLYPNMNSSFLSYRPVEAYVENEFLYIYVFSSLSFGGLYNDFEQNNTDFFAYKYFINNSHVRPYFRMRGNLNKFVFSLDGGFICQIQQPLSYVFWFNQDFIGF